MQRMRFHVYMCACYVCLGEQRISFICARRDTVFGRGCACEVIHWTLYIALDLNVELCVAFALVKACAFVTMINSHCTCAEVADSHHIYIYMYMYYSGRLILHTEIQWPTNISHTLQWSICITYALQWPNHISHAIQWSTGIIHLLQQSTHLVHGL